MAKKKPARLSKGPLKESTSGKFQGSGKIKKVDRMKALEKKNAELEGKITRLESSLNKQKAKIRTLQRSLGKKDANQEEEEEEEGDIDDAGDE
jgi:hypothetical protein